MLLYHGSTSLFNQFDYTKIRTNGTAEGVGFYFTTSKQIAQNYALLNKDSGYIYTIKADWKKPLSNQELTLSLNQALKVISYLHEEEDYLSNYGDVEYQGYYELLYQAVQSEYRTAISDTDFMGGLYNTCGGSQCVFKAFYNVLGYDHIKATPSWGGEHELYIALNNKNINIISIEDVQN